MAVHFADVPATFIHLPKTGGTSFILWAEQNVKNHVHSPNTHFTLTEASELWSNLGTTFTFVRNPFSKLVSEYFFAIKTHSKRMSDRKQNPNIKEFDTNILDDIRILKMCEKGFGYWLECLYTDSEEFTKIGKYHPNRKYYGKTNMIEQLGHTMPTIVIKTEYLSNEFTVIQKLFDCNKPIPHTNTTTHNSYTDYYDDRLIQMVEDMFGDDLTSFDYEFEKSGRSLC
jgi:hypothetical protein